MLYWCLLILITFFEIQTGIESKYSEVPIIENLPLEKNHFSENSGGSTYTVITTNDFRFNTYNILSTLFRYDRKSVNHLQALFIWCILETCSWKNMYNL